MKSILSCRLISSFKGRLPVTRTIGTRRTFFNLFLTRIVDYEFYLLSGYTFAPSDMNGFSSVGKLERFALIIDTVTEFSGRVIAWLTLVMVVAVVTVVVTRYFLSIGSIALQESVTYLHCAVFMLGLAYTLKKDGHVRVDIFYRQYNAKTKARVNFFGSLIFLLPLCLLLFFTSWDYVVASWSIRETSAENNGLPFIYLLKTLMLIMPVMLLLQATAEMIKNGILLFASASDTPDQNQSENSVL